MIRLKNVLVATDFSEPSNAAAEYRREFAHTFGATLTAMPPQVTHPDRRRRLDQEMPVALMLVFLSAWLSSVPCRAADFTCANGDVACLIGAIHQANANGQENTISLAAGVYTLSAAGLPSVSSTLTITGAGADLTSIERDPGAPLFGIVSVAPGGVLTLHGVTVRRGALEQFGSGAGVAVSARGSMIISESVVTENGGFFLRGGGVFAGGQVLITHSTISANRAGAGGGVYIAVGGSLTVESSTIARNNGDGGGGGILVDSQGTLRVADSLIDGNGGGPHGLFGNGGGGGIFVGGSGAEPEGGATVTITNSTISNNVGDVLGGGIAILPGNAVHISRSSIVDNRAQLGGGIDVGDVRTGAESRATVTLADSTITRNRALLEGGGLNVSEGTVSLRNSTIVGNLSNGTGGIGNYGGRCGGGAISLENAILALNNSPSPFSPVRDCRSVTSLGHNVFGDPTGCGALLSSDLTGDPGLGDFVDLGRPGTGHFPLLAGSRAIDAGDNAACGATDQLGLPRPVDGDGDGVRTCDIGAIEFDPVTITSLTAMPQVLWPPNHKMVSVSVAASASEGSAGAPVCQITAVSSDEGFTTPGQLDWAITGPLTVNLRAERAGSGHGRVYTITVTCTNAARGSATQNVTVTVPHDQGK